MPIQLFQYPLPADPELTDLNTFLASHRVVAFHRETVVTSAGPMLLFVVQWSHDGRERDQGLSSAARVDYREVLDQSQFDIFDRLREVRRQLATAEGIPVYKVFSNSQLAAMVQKKCHELSTVTAIPGIGKARAEKYATAILPLLQEAFGGGDAVSLENNNAG